jgi:hypothetical protein
LAGSNSTSGVNTMVGYQSGYTNTSGNATITGTRQTLIGYNTGANTSTQLNDIVCIGDTAQAGGSNTVVVGSAAKTVVGSNRVVAIGSGLVNAGTDSVIIGYGTGQGGTQMVVVGSLINVPSTITNSVLIGYEAGANLSGTVAGHTFVGCLAGASNATGINTFFGYQAGYSPAALGTTFATTTGTGQTCIGYQTGQAVVSATAPNYITCLGYETTVGASGGVAIGTDHTGAGATTSVQDEIKLGTANHRVSLSALKFNAAANESTGAGTALLGTNCPAVTVSAPYTWETVTTSDGSTGFIPVWK